MSDVLELVIERPVAGGRMLARHEGRVVFVAGAIPGERVRARVQRSSRQSLWAETVEVLEPSPDRRNPTCDPACGGLDYAHIAYDRQRLLKAEIIADAFRRLGRLELDELPSVAPSEEVGYRLRARLHVRDGRVGFFREGTHVLCDAGPTRQLVPAAVEGAAAAVAALGPLSGHCEAVVVSENVAGTERVLHLEPREAVRLDDAASSIEVMRASAAGGVTGVTTIVRGRLAALSGSESVTDTADTLFGTDSPVAPDVRWTRRPTSFFQGNRFLTGAMVRRVLEVAPGERCVDLYAGVGLFAVALAARGSRVVAVEGDESSGQDLLANAAPWASRLTVVRGAVEDAARRRPDHVPDVVIVDPPRTGMSADAVESLAGWGVPRLVYVSCDPPTLARDAARLVARGYSAASVDAFDLFPNTPHVESVVVFTRESRGAGAPPPPGPRTAR